jgi:acylphosphatase
VQRLHAVIHGDVQGVGFRYFVIDHARPLGVRGWVRNRADGTVEITAEGERRGLEELLDVLRRGPRGATVTDVDVEWAAASGTLGPFEISH